MEEKAYVFEYAIADIYIPNKQKQTKLVMNIQVCLDVKAGIL